MATIAEPNIKITLVGWDKVWSQLGKLTEGAKTLGKSLGDIGHIGVGAFTAATGGILGMLKAANPVGVEILLVKIQVLAAVIGKTFNPILEDCIRWLDKTIAQFRQMTDEQRDVILHWTKVGLAVSAVAASLAVVVPIISKVITIVQSLVAVFRVLMSVLSAASLINPWILAFAAIAGIVTLIAAKTGLLQSIFNGAKKAAAPIVDIFEKIWDVAESVYDKLAAGFDKVWERFKPIFAKVGVAFESIGELVGKLIGYFAELGSSILGDAFEMFGDYVAKKLDEALELVMAIADAIEFVVNSIQMAIDEAKEFIDSLDPFSDSSDGKNREAGGAGDFSKNKAKDSGGDYGGGDKYASRAPVSSPKFTSLADAYKQVQQSSQNDPKLELQRQQLENAKTQTGYQKTIADNTSKKSPSTFSSGGDWSGN